MTPPKIAVPRDRLSQLADERRHVVIIANPKSGAVSGIERTRLMQELLEAQGWSTSLWSNREAGQAAIQEHTAAGDLRCVVAAGGDGTAGMVAQWLDRTTPLAVFPLGTENLLAKFWRLTSEVERFVELLKDGCCVAADAGTANGRLFLLHATVGFDAEVVRRLHDSRQGHIRHWSYFAPIFKSIRQYAYPVMQITTSRDPRVLSARWAFIFNLPAYAMGLPIQPDADGLDGSLDLITFRGGHLLNGLRYLCGVLLRRHRAWRDIHIERTTWLRLQAEQPIPFQVDGDPGGFLPLEIEVLPRRLRLVVPRDSIRLQTSGG